MARTHSLLVLWLAVVLISCGTPQQVLNSPCVSQPATAAGGACPPCTTDADCTILSNTCQAAAFCVNKTSNWTVSSVGCDMMYLPNVTACGCVDSICKSK